MNEKNYVATLQMVNYLISNSELIVAVLACLRSSAGVSSSKHMLSMLSLQETEHSVSCSS